MDKKNIIIIVLSILLVIASTILVIKITKNNSSETKKEDVIVKNENINSFEITGCDKECDKVFRFNDNTLNIVKTSEGNYDILFNDYAVFSSAKTPYLGNHIYTFDDTILIETKDEYGTIKLMKYTLGDFNAKEYNTLEDEFWYIKSTSLKDNKITLNVSRFSKEYTFADINNKVLVDLKECLDFKEFSERDAEKELEVSYDNQTFSKPKVLSTKKLNEIAQYQGMCNESE